MNNVRRFRFFGQNLQLSRFSDYYYYDDDYNNNKNACTPTLRIMNATRIDNHHAGMQFTVLLTSMHQNVWKWLKQFKLRLTTHACNSFGCSRACTKTWRNNESNSSGYSLRMRAIHRVARMHAPKRGEINESNSIWYSLCMHGPAVLLTCMHQNVTHLHAPKRRELMKVTQGRYSQRMHAQFIVLLTCLHQKRGEIMKASQVDIHDARMHLIDCVAHLHAPKRWEIMKATQVDIHHACMHLHAPNNASKSRWCSSRTNP